MNLKEAAGLLGWKRELVELAISEGVETPRKKIRVKLRATPQGSDFDILDEEVDKFLAVFEAEEPGRNPPVAVRRELLVECRYQCAVCRSDAPLRFHHIIDWANLKHHDPKHMLAVCGSCHDKIGLGTIDTKAQTNIKEKLLKSHLGVDLGLHKISNKSAAPTPPSAQTSDATPKSSVKDLLESIGLLGDETVTVERFVRSSTDWFHNERFTEAFPGVRGLYEFSNPEQAVERLSILLKSPLKWVWDDSDGCVVAGHTPLWWWRGMENMPIGHYSVTSPTEILLDVYELPIKRVVAVNAGAYWQSFVYVETNAKPPIGLYESDAERDARISERFGYVHEEYGLYQGRAVTRAEYDDGAAVIDGKPYRIPGVQLRVRYLTPYNFVLAAHESPANNSKFDMRFSQLMNGILQGKFSVQDLANQIRELPRREHFGH
jgi:hypothetical protein